MHERNSVLTVHRWFLWFTNSKHLQHEYPSDCKQRPLASSATARLLPPVPWAYLAAVDVVCFRCLPVCTVSGVLDMPLALCCVYQPTGLPGPHLFTLDACIDILTETTPRRIGCVSHGDRFGSACECKLQHATCRDCPRLQSLLVHHPLAAAPGRHIVSAPGGCEAQD